MAFWEIVTVDGRKTICSTDFEGGYEVYPSNYDIATTGID
jgi:hypothetical protein